MATGSRRARALEIAALASALLPVLGSRDARAQDVSDAEPLGLDYAAPDECPPASAFFAEITARTQRARAPRTGEPARVLHVRLTRAANDDGHVGTLAIEDTTGTGSTRSMSGGTCTEVASALALVAALAVDPRADTTPRPPLAAPAPAPALAPAPAPAPTPALTPAPARRLHVSLGAAAELSMIADAVASLRVFGDLELSRDDAPDDVLAPSLRLAVARSLDRDVPSRSTTTTTLRWTQASLDVCPIRIAVGRNVALRPCVAGSAGVIQADALVSRTRPWATLGAHGRAVWAPIASLAFELEAGAIAPLYRESFFFEPSIPVYEAPVAAFVGRFGVALRFP